MATSLSEKVHIIPRFQRAVRIDTDLAQFRALDGFQCTASFARALNTLADQFARTGQGAFTWTGPYGGGKSSLVIALASLVGPRGKQRDTAEAAVGAELAATIRSAFRPGNKGWHTLAVVGVRIAPHLLVWEALLRDRLVRDHGGVPTAREVLRAIERVAARPTHAGLILVIDELGKVLEGAVSTFADIHFLQELAEQASRSDRRLVVIGILHQAFGEYATRLGKQAQDEWSKVQGRFVDIPLAVTGTEQLELIGGAINSQGAPKHHVTAVEAIAKALIKYRRETPATVMRELLKCWPIHPVTACLLGPISRRRFGQNQRSLFAFLNSHEPASFQEFLTTAETNELYSPAQLFDYLQLNLEAAILASPDGHRWALALDALERAHKHHAGAFHIALLKTIALLDLFHERSGLFATQEVLQTIFVDARSLAKALDDLKRWSVAAYREHLSTYAIFAGSDFDLQAALERARSKLGAIDLGKLKHLANLQPIVAKRHYHETGALRWFDVDVVSSADLEVRAKAFAPNGAMGQILLVVPTAGEPTEELRRLIKTISARNHGPFLMGLCPAGARVVQLAGELLELEYVRTHSPELRDDGVARREVDARTATCASLLETEVRGAFADAHWIRNGEAITTRDLADLARIASDVAAATYDQSPRLRNELLNRSAPSSNAVAAQKALLKLMVTRPSTLGLGIEGFPAERGLYESLLSATKLHRNESGSARFREPPASDPANLKPLWKHTDALLKAAKQGPISAVTIYQEWSKPPFGLREGLRPLLLVAYLLSRADRYTVYLDNKLEVDLNDLTIDRLTVDPASVTVRIFDASARERQLFEGMRETVRRLRPGSDGLEDVTALAIGLVQIARSQPTFTQRTSHLSPAATEIRSAFRTASDANVLLHEVVPTTLERILGKRDASVSDYIGALSNALEELASFYPRALCQLDSVLRSELGVTSDATGINELGKRAARLHGMTGDLRLEAFITRMKSYRAEPADIEGVASLAANKPCRDWSDHDFDRALIEIADLAQRFNHAEAFARVKGRPDGRHAIAVVVGLDRTPALAFKEFQISERERRTAVDLARRIKELTSDLPVSQEIFLAALAEVSSDLLHRPSSSRKRAANE